MNGSETISTDADVRSDTSHDPVSELRSPERKPDLLEPIGILLVDDEPKNLTVLESILAEPQYKLVRAETVDQALLALIVEEFALIVLDIQMPGMSGFELASMIKQRRKTADLPIIFLTAYYSEDQHILEGYGTGAVDYLHKPVNPTILRSKVAVFAELYRKNRENELANRALLTEVGERRRIQSELIELNNQLEERVHGRTFELRTANSALRESERQLELAQRAGKVGIWDWDLKSGKGTWSDAAWELFSPRAPKTDVNRETWLGCIHEDDRRRAIHAFEDAGITGRYRDEFRLAVQDAGIQWVESVGAVEFENGIPIRMRGAVRDITDRKAIELKLFEANRLKDQFLAMLGHELRNPLAPIRNVVSILQEGGANAQHLQWCCDVLDRQAEQLARIVNDLLDVSRVSQGKIQLERTVLDLAAAIQQAVETSRPLIDARGQTLNLNLPADPVRVHGDLTRLAQVVANLLNNSAKYSDEGGSIWLDLERISGSPQLAIIRIRDNGRGFDPDMTGNLFELFFQVDYNLDRSAGGLGIGLALVRNLIHLHGGTVEATSPGRGKGSEFVVRLPCVSAAEVGDILPAVASDGTPLTAKVLVVDDNLDSANSLSLLLELRGHTILLAENGHRAVEVALSERPEIVIMDIGLPGISGYEACQSMRQNGLSTQLIVAMTGYGQSQDRCRALEAGFDEHLVKPVDINTIQQLLDIHLARRHAR